MLPQIWSLHHGTQHFSLADVLISCSVLWLCSAGSGEKKNLSCLFLLLRFSGKRGFMLVKASGCLMLEVYICHQLYFEEWTDMTCDVLKQKIFTCLCRKKVFFFLGDQVLTFWAFLNVVTESSASILESDLKAPADPLQSYPDSGDIHLGKVRFGCSLTANRHHQQRLCGNWPLF